MAQHKLVVLIWKDLTPPYPRDSWPCVETFWVLTAGAGVGGGCCWHLVGRGLRCRTGPTTETERAPDASSVATTLV